MFLKLDDLEQDYVIRLTSKRKLLYHNKWTPATELRDRRKGKIKTSVFYRGKEHEAYLSHVRVQITASGRFLSFVHRLSVLLSFRIILLKLRKQFCYFSCQV